MTLPTPDAPVGSADAPSQGDGVRAVLGRVADMAAAAGRDDLAARLRRHRQRLDTGAFQVLVVGEFGRGKSALVNALVGAPVCGVSAQAATAVPTVVRYGARPAAAVVPAIPEDGIAVPETGTIEVPLGDAPRLALGREDPVVGSYGAVVVDLPREVLRDGLTLVDTAGVGGGFAATAAVGILRAVGAADALLFVTDASAELTFSEVEFLREAISLCPLALCVMTKRDLYPRWRRLAELDREHLARAGLTLPVIPVSSVVRELAIDTGDAALAAESGFPVLLSLLAGDLRRHWRSARFRVAAAEASAAVQQVRTQAEAELRSIRDPAGRQAQVEALREVEQRAARIHGASARWQQVLADAMRTLRKTVPRDRDDRMSRVRTTATQRIEAGDPREEWAVLEPWLARTVNTELLAHHRKLLDGVQRCAAEVADQFGVEVDRLVLDAPVPDADAAEVRSPTQAVGQHTAARIDVVLAAARGFTLGGSVVGGIYAAVGVLTAFTAFLPAMPVVAAVAAVAGLSAGGTFGARSVSALRASTLRSARAELARAVTEYVDQQARAAARADDDLLDDAFVRLRDHFSELAAQELDGARAALAVATAAADLDGTQAGRRTAHAERVARQADALTRALEASLAASAPGVAP